jgi:DNA-binding LacI/PurR family transcriptional regulator
VLSARTASTERRGPDLPTIGGRPVKVVAGRAEDHRDGDDPCVRDEVGEAMAEVAPLPVMALATGFAEYQVRVLRGLAGRLERHGVPLLVVAHEPIATDRTPSLVLDLIRHRQVRGVIALADASDFPRPELPAALLRAGLPTVTLGRRLGQGPVVLGEAASGMRELMRHLLDECGVRRPVLLRGTPDHVDSIEREDVFRAEMARRNLPVDENLVIDGDFRPTEAYDALNVLLRRTRDVDAVVALNDMSAFGALSALTDHGLRVPQDVLLSGFDNTFASETAWPPLSTVDAGLEEQGGQAVDLLLRAIERRPGRDETPIGSRLVVRASTQRHAAAVSLERYEVSLQALQTRWRCRTPPPI